VYDYTKSVAINTPKSYGKSIKASDLPEGVARFFPRAPDDQATKTTTPTVGLPSRFLLPILQAIRKDVARIREAVAGIEMRMVAGSLLIIYEADWKRAEEGLKFLEERGQKETDEDEDDEDDEDEDEDDEDEDNDAKGFKKPRAPYIVKLIDFAHTRMKPGEGPDKGVLTGFDTVLRLLDGRIKELRAAGV
jgi:inositol-polyphosphate multikinase